MRRSDGGGAGPALCSPLLEPPWAAGWLDTLRETFHIPSLVPLGPPPPGRQARTRVGAPPRQGRRGEGPWCGVSPRTAPPHPHFCSCSAGTQPPGRQRLRRRPAHGCRAILADPGSRAAAPQPQGPETCVRLGSVAGRTCRDSVSSSCSNRSHLSTERHYFFNEAVFLLNKYKLCLRHPLFYVSMCFASGEAVPRAVKGQSMTLASGARTRARPLGRSWAVRRCQRSRAGSPDPGHVHPSAAHAPAGGTGTEEGQGGPSRSVPGKRPTSSLFSRWSRARHTGWSNCEGHWGMHFTQWCATWHGTQVTC